MGFGDVKYMGMIGGFLGWDGVLLGFLVAILAGALCGIVIKLVTKDSYMPFGPFLSLGALTVILAEDGLVYVIFDAYPRAIRGLIGVIQSPLAGLW